MRNKYQKSSLIDSCCQELFQKSFDLLLHFLCSNLLPIDSTKMSNISLMQFLLNILLFDIEVNVITNLLKHQINRQKRNVKIINSQKIHFKGLILQNRHFKNICSVADFLSYPSHLPTAQVKVSTPAPDHERQYTSTRPCSTCSAD